MSTISYYDENASTFVEGTVNVDFRAIQEKFTACLKPGARILDFGCGSGRDTKAFLDQGFEVDAIDGSQKLCELASIYTGISVKQVNFKDFEAEPNSYDGIWACASLLHLPKEDLAPVLCKLKEALKSGGTMYCSFKYGDFEGERNGRYFTDLTEDSIQHILTRVGGLEIRGKWISEDVRPGRKAEKWLNVLVGRK